VRTVSRGVRDYLEAGFECWSRRAIDEMMEMYAPDAEVDLSRLLPDERVVRGRSQIGAYYDRMWDTWSEFAWSPTEYHELGDGEYAVLVSLDAEGRSSGTPVTAEISPSSTRWSTDSSRASPSSSEGPPDSRISCGSARLRRWRLPRAPRLRRP
jgi:ketosteroid isomerase-like protein